MRKLTLITLALVIFLSGCTSIDDSEEVNIENQIENEDESKEENYEELRYLGDNTYTAKLESSYGVIDKEKNILIPFEFENIQAKDDDYYIAYKNGKVGITTEESVILEYNYDSIREADGIYFIKKDGKIGIFNTENKEVIEPKYDMALPVSENYIVIQKNGLFGLIGLSESTLIEPKYTSVPEISEAKILVMDETMKYGYIDKNGINITDFIYDSASKFYNGRAVVENEEFFGIIDESGNRIKDLSDLGSDPFFTDGATSFVFRNDDYSGLMSFEGEIISPADKVSVFPHINGYGIVSESFGEIKYIDMNGETVLEFPYDIGLPFDENNIAKVAKNTTGYGLINIKGEILLEPVYDNVYEMDNFNNYMYKKDERYGLITKKGEVKFETLYNKIIVDENQEIYIAINYNSKKIFDINSDSIREIELEDFNIDDYKSGYYRFKKDGKYGVKNLDGQIIIEPIYKELKILENETAIASEENGKEIIILGK